MSKPGCPEEPQSLHTTPKTPRTRNIFSSIPSGHLWLWPRRDPGFGFLVGMRADRENRGSLWLKLGSVLYSWNRSTFPVWLWTSHVSQSPRTWGQAAAAPNQVFVCLFVCLAKRGFRSLIFDIQGVLINLWSVCLRSRSSVEFLESTGCEAGCLYVHLGVFSSQGWSGGDSSP